MKKEDIEFLKELQHELQTQDTDCQAEPKYWGIVCKTKDYGIAYGYEDGTELYIDQERCIDSQFTTEELLKWAEIEELDDVEEEELKRVKNIYELENLLESEGYDCHVANYRMTDKVTEETGCFLTKRACEKHIKLNHYHYSKPHAYAMTAWRNPEFERVLKILTETNWDMMEVE